MKTMNNARIQVENQKKYVIIKLEQNRTKGEKMVLVATQVKRRRGTTAENDAFTGAEGEITVDLTKKTLRVHDGSTQGGTELAKSSDIYTQTEIDNLLSGKSSTDLSNITATGKETIAHNAMPKNTYITLTLGATGAVYTAPADGYATLEVSASSASLSMCALFNQASGTGMRSYSYTATASPKVLLPVSKGDKFIATYSNCTLIYFRFIYANGAQ